MGSSKNYHTETVEKYLKFVIARSTRQHDEASSATKQSLPWGYRLLRFARNDKRRSVFRNSTYMRLLRYQLKENQYIRDSAYFRAGISVVEVVVTLSIIVFIGAQVLASFSGLNQAATLKRSAQELSFNLRRAQNMALAVAPVQIGPGGSGCAPRPSPCIPQAVGIRVTTSSADTAVELGGGTDGIPDNGEYFFFTDQNGNSRYNGVSERIEPSIILPNGIRITAITGATVINPDTHIIFYTPEARTALTNNAGVSVGPFMEITLTAPQGGTTKVRVMSSGQVNVL